MGSFSDACLIGLPVELQDIVVMSLADLADVRSLYGVSHYFQDVVEAALPRWLQRISNGDVVNVSAGTIRFLNTRIKSEWSVYSNDTLICFS